MRYKTRKGIVLTSVCGQPMLVAATEAREECPYITQINDTAAFCWRLLEEGSTFDILTHHLMEEYEVEDESLVRDDIRKLLDVFLEQGYIYQTEDKEDQDDENE